MEVSAYHLNTLFQLIYVPKSSQIHRAVFRILWLKFHLLLASKDGKSGHTLMNNRTMKGNGFDTGLTSQSNLHRYFQRTIQPRSQGLSSLPPLSLRIDNGSREERPWERSWELSKQFVTSTRYRTHSPSLLGYHSMTTFPVFKANK